MFVVRRLCLCCEETLQKWCLFYQLDGYIGFTVTISSASIVVFLKRVFEEKMKASSSSSSVGTAKKKKSRIDIIKAKRESGWSDRVFNHAPIPEDKGGPRTQMRRFNNMSKKAAEDNAKKGKTASTWMENVLKSSFDDVPLKLTPSLRDKAGHAIQTKETAEEIEIIQKIIVRENLLDELNRLLDNHNGLYGVLGEIDVLYVLFLDVRRNIKRAI